LIEFNPELRAIDVRVPENVSLVIANSLTPSPKLLTVGTRYNKRVVECRFGLLIMALKLGKGETWDQVKYKNFYEL
jgi:galactokinase